ncbi:HNH endonuclease signature motif containing protein [Arthrobacter sp. CJ23]|uniref:HNH endonuclease signature motif containing protein n=1 Tax=Arthrobacter sp. CJ23 TaxID=2972479 RepID=UPI00215C5F0B|nr:HNH endonuclease signature motif containing protein [Arthrobacter sp. CJ23]UVJ39876.1 HNH endonuclease [Arthrobacter sp. CJ23]
MEITTGLDEWAPQPVAVPDPLLVLDGLVSTLESLEAAIAGLQAIREYTLAMASRLAEMMNDGGSRPEFAAAGRDSRSAELAQRAVAAEIATATRANDRTVQRQMGQAVELPDRFPVTFRALAQGRISLAHARVIQDAGTRLDDPAALSRYESVVVACAERQAPGRVGRMAVREAEKAQPWPLTTRHEQAVAERCVRVTPLPDGMAELAATLPAAVAHSIHRRLTRMARTHAEAASSAGPAAPGRNTDQLRADLLADLLLRGAPSAHDTPHGHLAAITARIRVLTDPLNGAVLTVDRYRPGEDLKRLLTARDSRCRFPGCGIKGRKLDLDHTHDAALGGPTETGNLAGLRRRHHMLKHHTAWKAGQAGAGILEWTSPTGRTYTDHPPIPASYTATTARTPGPAPGGSWPAPGSGLKPTAAPAPPPFRVAPVRFASGVPLPRPSMRRHRSPR